MRVVHMAVYMVRWFGGSLVRTGGGAALCTLTLPVGAPFRKTVMVAAFLDAPLIMLICSLCIRLEMSDKTNK